MKKTSKKTATTETLRPSKTTAAAAKKTIERIIGDQAKFGCLRVTTWSPEAKPGQKAQTYISVQKLVSVEHGTWRGMLAIALNKAADVAAAIESVAALATK